MSYELDTEVNDYLVRILLRYCFKAGNVSTSRPDEVSERDVDLLRLHWAISRPVRQLIEHLTRNRHEIQAVLETHIVEDDAKVRGCFDARASMIRRQVTGHPTLTVSREPVRTYESGPNHVLTWVLETAWRLALSLDHKLPEGASYRESLQKCTPSLEKVRRFDAIHHASKQINLTRRPGNQALKEAKRSRRLIYSMAYHAYHYLQQIEKRDEDSIIELLNDTLLGPLNLWQRYELVAGLTAARGLSEALSMPVEIGFLYSNSEPIFRIGGYKIFWQSRTSAYTQPDPEPSEVEMNRLLAHYGLTIGADRPDLVVLDPDGNAVSIIEVKCFQNHEAERGDDVRMGMSQLVRYARGYQPIHQIRDLLDTSIVAVVEDKISRFQHHRPYGIPLVVDFKAMKESLLVPWANQLLDTVKKEREKPMGNYESVVHNSKTNSTPAAVH